jgi:hypothetical protein
MVISISDALTEDTMTLPPLAPLDRTLEKAFKELRKQQTTTVFMAVYGVCSQKVTNTQIIGGLSDAVLSYNLTLSQSAFDHLKQDETLFAKNMLGYIKDYSELLYEDIRYVDNMHNYEHAKKNGFDMLHSPNMQGQERHITAFQAFVQNMKEEDCRDLLAACIPLNHEIEAEIISEEALSEIERDFATSVDEFYNHVVMVVSINNTPDTLSLAA